MSLSRLMGIDYGERRIGIALSDLLQLISKPFIVIPNNGSEVFSKINTIIKEQQVSGIVLGLPLNLEGEDTKKTKEVRIFNQELQSSVDIPVVFWDERYTSAEAREALKQMGVDSRDNKKQIDMIAASIILKDYMENRKPV